MSNGSGPGAPDLERLQRYIGSLMDSAYNRYAGPAVDMMVRASTSGIVAQRLAELDAECARLAQEGKALTGDNAILRALLADVEDANRANAAMMQAVGTDLQGSAAQIAGQSVRTTALQGMTDEQLATIGLRWNTPDPNAIAQIVNYTGSDAWNQLLKDYPTDLTARFREIALRGIVNGQGPLETAQELALAVKNLPIWQANNLMRTLQLTSYRDAAVMHRVANADILGYSVRIAALDGRTCMACVALHGTRLPIDARIDDHHSGRCDSISVVKGREAPDIMTGEEWFRKLPEAQQRAMMGNAAHDAWKSGAIQMSQFVQPYKDSVFGQMVREASLKGMLGDGAKTFYGGGNNPDDTLGARNRVALYEARNVTPLGLETGRATGPLADELMNMFAYNDNGDPIFSREMTGQYKDNLFYNVYTLGRGTLPEKTIYSVRQQAAAALRADEYLNGSVLSRKERNYLTRMASPNDDTVAGAIDQIRDRRMSGNLDSRAATAQGGFRGEAFTTIGEDEGAARLRENRR